MQVREIMSQNVTSCTPESTLEEAARLMEEHDCGAIPVVEEGTEKLMGIVTDRDIVCRAVAQGRNPAETQVQECMSEAPATVLPDTDVEICCEIMEKEQVRRVPVVDLAGKCCGIVAQADIARRAPEHEVAEVVRDISQPSRRGS